MPRGWWHCVLNLGRTVAVTQNFVSSTGLPRVLEFLRPGRVELVSGCGVQDRWVWSVGVVFCLGCLHVWGLCCVPVKSGLVLMVCVPATVVFDSCAHMIE